MSRQIVAGLDIGTAAIRLVVAELVKDSPLPRILAQVRQESRGLRRGYLVNFDETLQNLREALREAERQSKIRVQDVVLGIGGVTLEATVSDGQVAVAKADLEIGPSDLARAVEASEANLNNFANRRILHSQPIAFKVDGQKVLGRPEGLKGQKLEVRTLFIHCLEQHLNDLVRVVNAAGVSIDEVVPAPIAASLPTLTTTQKMAGCLLANIGSQTTSIITFEEGLPLSLQVFPFGSNDITNDIALGLSVSLDEAERLKLDVTPTVQLKRKLDEIIEARLSDILELMEGHLKKIKRSGFLPAGIIIVGGGGHVNEIERLARTTLHLPAKLFDPLSRPQLKNQMKDASWAVAYGLVLHALRSDAGSSFGPKFFGGAKTKLVNWLRELVP